MIKMKALDTALSCSPAQGPPPHIAGASAASTGQTRRSECCHVSRILRQSNNKFGGLCRALAEEKGLTSLVHGRRVCANSSLCRAARSSFCASRELSSILGFNAQPPAQNTRITTKLRTACFMAETLAVAQGDASAQKILAAARLHDSLARTAKPHRRNEQIACRYFHFPDNTGGRGLSILLSEFESFIV